MYATMIISITKQHYERFETEDEKLPIILGRRPAPIIKG
jgi:hypothetical protein